jgi:hypothetical protein
MKSMPSCFGELRPYQREIIQAAINSVGDEAGFCFSVEIARQGGKNELSAWLETCVLAAYFRSPVNIIKCAPTLQPQAMISLRRLCGCLDNAGYGGHYTVEAGHIVKLGNARVIFLSAEESANVVGNTAHLLLEVDEAQDVSIEKFDRDFRPMAATRNATTVLYGTPWRDGNLLDITKQQNLDLERGDGVKRHFRHDWEDVAAFNPDYRAYVEGERARLGENHPTFRSQYALLNASDGGGFFSEEQLIRMMGDFPRHRSPRPGAVYVGGLDFGGEGKISADSTVLTIAEVTEVGGSRLVRVVQHYVWTGHPFTLLLQTVAETAKGWGLRRLAADATGLGSPLVAALKQSLGHRVVPVVFTSTSKSELGFNLLATAGTGGLQIYKHDLSPQCAECWRELEAAAADYKPNRTLNFYVDPSKGHDDYLMSLALTVEAANSYEPRAAVGRMG